MIDFHVHQPSPSGAWGASGFDAKTYVEFMDGVGVDVSVVFTIDGLLDPSRPGNDGLRDYVAAAPDRLVGFGTCAPRDPAAPDEVERALGELGLRGIKFHPWLQGFAPHEPFMDPICEVAARHQAPILFHDGTPPYSTPLQIAALAGRHPRTPMVLGHGGLHDMWREAIVAVNENENLHICMCGLPPYAMRRVVDDCPVERILFGTDGGLGDRGDQPYVATRLRHLQELDLTDDQRAAITDRNARRLLRWQ
jgi:predicted TIM-barrel fold metal-dependent hydrolase